MAENRGGPRLIKRENMTAPTPSLGRPAGLSAVGAPAYGDGLAIYEYKHRGEWIPAETAIEDDNHQPIPPAPSGLRHLLVHFDPVRHFSSGPVGLRLNVPFDDREGEPAEGDAPIPDDGIFRKRFPGASRAEAERRAREESATRMQAPDLYADDPAAYPDEQSGTADKANGKASGSPDKGGW